MPNEQAPLMRGCSVMYWAFLEAFMGAMEGDYEGLAWWERVTMRYRASWGPLEL